MTRYSLSKLSLKKKRKTDKKEKYYSILQYNMDLFL